MKKVIGALVALLLVAGCSSINTQSDQAGLHYKAGALSSTHFANCVGQGTRNFDGPGDKHYSYPAGQRTFDFSSDDEADAHPINVVSKDNQTLEFDGGLTFQLDTDCNKVTINGHEYKGGMLQAFHERIGLKYKAFMNGDEISEGWKAALRFYMGKPLTNDLQNAAGQYNWLDLYTNPAIRATIEKTVNDNLAQAVKNLTGGQDYFTNFNLIINKPIPDEKLVTGLAAVQQAVLQRKAVQNQNLTVVTELSQIKSLVKVLGPYGYVLYKALKDCEADNGNSGNDQAGCPAILPVPQGGNINIQPGSR